MRRRLCQQRRRPRREGGRSLSGGSLRRGGPSAMRPVRHLQARVGVVRMGRRGPAGSACGGAGGGAWARVHACIVGDVHSRRRRRRASRVARRLSSAATCRRRGRSSLVARLLRRSSSPSLVSGRCGCVPQRVARGASGGLARGERWRRRQLCGASGGAPRAGSPRSRGRGVKKAILPPCLSASALRVRSRAVMRRSSRVVACGAVLRRPVS